MRRSKLDLALLLAVLLAQGCGGGGGSPGNPPVAAAPATTVPAAAQTLSYDDLMSGTSTAPVSDAAFAMPADAAAATRAFSGTLELLGEQSANGFKIVADIYNYAAASGWKSLPKFRYQFVRSGDDLIPVTQGLSITGSSYWNYILGPGKIWHQSGDKDMDRASLPFTLVERNANCTHNGLLTFLFDGVKVSGVRYQVTQETCPYFKFDMWGSLSATYTPESIANAEAIKTDFIAEVANRLPTKPLSALATDFPKSGVNLANFGKWITPAAMTAYGLLIDGTNYVSACTTRYGVYPYCNAMWMTSMSTAKSAFAGIALMRLGQKYGKTVYDLKIGAYLPEAIGSPGNWNTVTFNNTIDMATGNYNLTKYMFDEDNLMSKFYAAESYGDRISAALAFSAKQPPGQLWVYHTSDTFLLTRAMNNYLAQQQGAGADIFNMVRDEVYKPLHLSAAALTAVRTDNSTTGTPFGGYGLFWTQDDIAKIALLLNNQHGIINGIQLLNADMLADSMQQNPLDRGLTTTDTPSFSYNNGFWAKQMTPAEFPQFSCSFWIPFMSGLGGITVVMMPNGSTYYYFSDNNEYFWYDAVLESDKLRSFCS